MSGVAVVTDSTSSLAPGQAEHADIAVVPLQVVIDGVSRPESEVPPAQVAAALRDGRRVSTSRPNPEVIATTYSELVEAGYDAIVSVHLSGKISGTCDAAAVAARRVDRPVIVVDSGTVAMGAGFAALSGAAAARAGGDIDAVAAVVRARAATASFYFYVDSLEYLRRGGRISATAAVLGSALSVKPILTMVDGEIRASERVRTESRALARLDELALSALARAAGRSDRVGVAVHHLDNPKGAQRLVDRLSGRVPAGEIVVSEMSAVLGVHVGPGTVGVVVSPEQD
jgi:DegV family protein with EDD domain